MKILYIDCGMGAAGDMLTAALLDACTEDEKKEILQQLNNMGIPDVTYTLTKSVKCGITGSHMEVAVAGVVESEDMYDHHYGEHEHHHDEHEHHHGEDDHHHDSHHDQHHEHEHSHEGHEAHHHHHSMSDIMAVVNSLNVSDRVKKDVENVYGLIAEAESHVHGVKVEDIHFHEVGTMDAIADITAVCVLFEKIAADKVVASPVHVGSGQVRCAHGILPVPAPATAFILKSIPIYGGQIKGELCTPTGAALLKYFVDEFGSMPVMSSDQIGYGMGKKDFDRANCVRVIVGTEEERDQVSDGFFSSNDRIVELSCNIDDMTGEEIGFAADMLMQQGARDVFTIPIYMKKGRPAVLLRVICQLDDREMIVKAIFKYTSTIGIRETLCNRYILDRSMEQQETEYGTVRKKTVSGYGVSRAKYEYEDLARIARQQDISISEVKNKLD